MRCLWRPSESSELPFAHARCRAEASSSRIGYSFRVFNLPPYRRIGLTIPLRRQSLLPAVWSFVSRPPWEIFRKPSDILSSSFASVQSFDRPFLAGQPQPSGSSHGLLLPSALAESKVHLVRVLPARYGPPTRFGYPLDGLLPSIPCRFYFTPAALLGFTLRSVPLSQGTRPFPAEWTHMPFLPRLLPPPKRRAGPAGRGS
jgi:hypothetical protein